jgi:hypothetical protein
LLHPPGRGVQFPVPSAPPHWPSWKSQNSSAAQVAPGKPPHTAPPPVPPLELLLDVDELEELDEPPPDPVVPEASSLLTDPEQAAITSAITKLFGFLPIDNLYSIHIDAQEIELTRTE